MTTFFDYFADNNPYPSVMNRENNTVLAATIENTLGTASTGSAIDLLYGASSAMEVYFQPILIILGVFGNVLSFQILSLPNYKQQSTCIYMKGMAVSDSMYLVMYVLQRTVISVKNRELRTSFPGFKWICNQYAFWGHNAGIASATMLQAMSLERLFAMLFPLKATTWCSAGKATRFVFVLFIALVVILLPVNMFRERQAKVEGWLCPYHFSGEFSTIYDHFISIFNVYLPFVVLSFSNIGIVVVLKTSERNRSDLTVGTKKKTSNPVIRMLIIVSMAFLVFKLPNAAQKAFWNAFLTSDTGVSIPLITALQRFTVTLTEILQYCNYAFNNYLYILPVRKFRQDAKRVLCSCSAEARSKCHTDTSMHGPA